MRHVLGSNLKRTKRGQVGNSGSVRGPLTNYEIGGMLLNLSCARPNFGVTPIIFYSMSSISTIQHTRVDYPSWFTISAE